MRKKILITIVAIIMALSTFIFAACQKQENLSAEIKVPTANLQYALDDSVKILKGGKTDFTRENIDRGFRFETYYTLGSGQAWPGDGIDGIQYLNEMLEYYSEPLTQIQVYIYLTEYKDKDIDHFALWQMKTYFEYIRSKGMSMILRYAYEPDQNGDNAPSQKQMLKNIAILKHWISQNIDLWYSTVTVHQIGHIGAWGEFGSSKVKYDRKKIVNAICDMTPEKTYIQGRYTDVTDLADKKYSDRLGYHNDFLIGRPHPWNTAGGDNDSARYKQFANNNILRLNDGEMPWAGGTEEPKEVVDGKKLLQQLYEHHMTSLSLEHNYKEFIKGGKQPTSYYNLMRYKTETVTLDDVKKLGLPYYTEYFTKYSDTPIPRTIFEYIQDFLGYRLVLSNYSTSVVPNATVVNFMITNFGFGAPLNIIGAELVVRDYDGKEKIFEIKDFDATALTTYGQLKISIKVPMSLQSASYGIRFIRAGGYNIRTANDIPYNYGINYLNI